MTVNYFDNPELYDSIVLAGVRSPGKVTLSGHDRKVQWDIKQGSGTKGASITKKSELPVEFTASFYLVKDPVAGIDDIAAWPAFAALINSTVSGKTKALDVYHPDLAENEINSVVKGTILGATRDEKGGETRVVKFQEYKPSKLSGGTPSGSSTKPKAPGTAPDPNAAANAELAKLTDQYNQTPWG